MVQSGIAAVNRLPSLILANPGKEYALYLDEPPARGEGGARCGMALEPGT